MKRAFISLLNTLGMGVCAYVPEPGYIEGTLKKFLGEDIIVESMKKTNENIVSVIVSYTDKKDKPFRIDYTVERNVIRKVEISNV